MPSGSVRSSLPDRPLKKTRPVRSCTQCKQMKHGCDARLTHPAPCSRCASKGLDCVVDVQFRRTPARERLNRLNHEIDTLKRSLEDVNADKKPHGDGPPSSTSSESDSGRGEAVARDQEQSRPLSFCSSSEMLLDIQDDHIGDCTISREELIPLFATFVAHFYKHLPIINPSMTPRAIQRGSPFLFWTIITIVIQRAPRAGHQHRSVVIEAYGALLGKAILATPLTLPIIQGLLYICTWPLPAAYQARDHSWNLIGMAVNAAQYSGLHKSTHPPSLRSVGVFGDSPIRSTLWLACFYTSTWISQSIGVPPTLRSAEDLATITRITAEPIIPRHLAAMTEIQICVAKYTTLISESSENHVASSLERAFKYELDLTKERFTTIACWDTDIECIFLTARLHLTATLAVSQSKQLDAAGEGSFDTIQGSSLRVSLSEGLSSATRLIQVICLGRDQPAPTEPLSPAAILTQYSLAADDLYMQGLPKLYFRALVFATFYLLRYHVSGTFTLGGRGGSSANVDADLARSYVGIACGYLREHSTDPSDEPGRSAAAIETLSRYSASGRGITRSMTISDRLGASIMYDALTMASELRTRPVRLMSEHDEPQQAVEGSTGDGTPDQSRSLPTAAYNGDGLGVESRLEQDASNTEYLDSLTFPDGWMEDFDMEFGELSRDLFSEAALLG